MNTLLRRSGRHGHGLGDWVNPWVGLGWVKDPFAAVRDCASSSASLVASSETSGREELARYKALRVPAKHSTPLCF